MKREQAPALGAQDIAARPRSSISLLLLVVGLTGGLLYVARAAFIPVALALLLTLLLSGPVEALHRRGLPRGIGAIVILMLSLALIGGAINLLWSSTQQAIAAAPRAIETIEEKFGSVARFVHRVDVAAGRVDRLAMPGASPPALTATPLSAPRVAGGLLLATRAALITVTTVMILTLFLLAAGPPVLARMTAALASELRARQLLRTIEAVRSQVGRYYATIAMINLGLGLATTLLMRALGMPDSILCGVLAGLLNFIPYLGSATTLVVVSLVAFASFDSIGRVVAVAASYLGLATIEGQIIQPVFVGRRLALDPIIAFLALWFGGWFWGIAGIIIAIPALVALKVAAAHSENGASAVQFLSRGGGSWSLQRRTEAKPPTPAAEVVSQHLRAS